MAQVYVTKERKWYQALAGLKNNDEKDLEIKLLGYARNVFSDYYTFQSAYSFKNINNLTETAGPDILLIGKDFSEWVILELELINKGLDHTRKQLRVFSNPWFDINDFIKHCVGKYSDLAKYKKELSTVFKAKPKVVIMFDTYHKETFETITKEFKDIKFCVFEVYRTNKHDHELYRFSGDYPYIASLSSMLIFNNYDQYQIVRTEILRGYIGKNVELLYKGTKYKANINVSRKYRGKSKWYLEIRNNNLPSNRNLFLSKTLSGKFIIEVTS